MNKLVTYYDFTPHDISNSGIRISSSQAQCLSNIMEHYIVYERKPEFFVHIITFLIDTESNVSTGFCYLNIRRGDNTGEIFQVWVDEQYRNKKNAVALMRESICRAQATNPRAISFSMPLSTLDDRDDKIPKLAKAVESALIDALENTSVFLEIGGTRREVKKARFPNTIFHYTNSAVLLSIVKNAAIWLGGRWHLNDFHEGEVFKKIIKEHAVLKNFNNVDSIISNLDKLNFYVNCMTSNGDMLSQWRGYAENGSGVSIGFDTETLKCSIAGSHEALLYPVEYADNFSELSSAKQAFVNSAFNDYEFLSDKFLQSATKERWAVKGKGFKEEAEIRLMITPGLNGGKIQFANGATAEHKYRATESDIRDYYELKFPQEIIKNLIRSVVLGPKNTSDISTVERYLKSNGYDNVTVSRSKTTYR